MGRCGMDLNVCLRACMHTHLQVAAAWYPVSMHSRCTANTCMSALQAQAHTSASARCKRCCICTHVSQAGLLACIQMQSLRQHVSTRAHHVEALPGPAAAFVHAAPDVVHALPAARICLQAHHAWGACRILIAAARAQLVSVWRRLAAAAAGAGAAGCSWLLLLLLLLPAYEREAGCCFLLRVVLLTARYGW